MQHVKYINYDLKSMSNTSNVTMCAYRVHRIQSQQQVEYIRYSCKSMSSTPYRSTCMSGRWREGAWRYAMRCGGCAISGDDAGSGGNVNSAADAVRLVVGIVCMASVTCMGKTVHGGHIRTDFYPPNRREVTTHYRVWPS